MGALVPMLLRLLFGVGAAGGVLLAAKLGAGQTMLDLAASGMAAILDLADVPPPAMPPIADYLATAELVIPVYFWFDLIVTYCTILVALMAYKFVRSWIPTV